ncbi:MAG: tetraacyldisaccharide 4'-kinase [Bacteroidetes bacterium]|nr:tetraacyldisaccharide 4'-kinase [Bacteroidota bacterium]
MRFLQLILFPFAILYGLIMLVRNLLYDLRILPSGSFPVPVITVGNLSFGGTGKTPHVEYLIRLLSPGFLTATLSRGYGRDSKGFILGSIKSNVNHIGDEPLQYVRKFHTIKVAVDENRARGIRKLVEEFPDLGVVLMDDGFQHRSVKPGLSILLTDYHHLYTEDHVFPSGRLREFRSGAKRADIIIVTKTSKVFSPISRRRIFDEIRPKSSQHLFFSYITYGSPVSFLDDEIPVAMQKPTNILLFTGIADDYPLQEEVRRRCSFLTVIKFPDHHQYTMKDLENIRTRFDDLPTRKKIIITTEKDMMRLKTPEMSNFLKNLPLFYLPIEVNLHEKDKETFDKLILDYVGKNQRNR